MHFPEFLIFQRHFQEQRFLSSPDISVQVYSPDKSNTTKEPNVILKMSVALILKKQHILNPNWPNTAAWSVSVSFKL